MKKIQILLLTVISLASLQAAYGQVQIGIGLKGGLNFASLNGVTSPSAAFSNSTGYHAGAYFLFKFTKIGIQPEIIFSKQGHSFKTGTTNYTDNIDYINIPVMLKLYLAGGFNLQAGPQFGFVSKATGNVINTATGTITSGQDIKSFLQTTDVSVGVGLGWDLPFGLNLGARYNIGVADINKYTGGTIPGGVATSLGTSSAKNQVFQLSVGYRLFKLGN